MICNEVLETIVKILHIFYSVDQFSCLLLSFRHLLQ